MTCLGADPVTKDPQDTSKFTTIGKQQASTSPDISCAFNLIFHPTGEQEHLVSKLTEVGGCLATSLLAQVCGFLSRGEREELPFSAPCEPLAFSYYVDLWLIESI